MFSIKDYLMQIKDNDPILRKKLFDVPMRLFRADESFRMLIHEIVNHMQAAMNTKYDDYKEVKGISGANAGIPYNIIIVKDKEKKEDLVFINPLMGALGKEMVEVSSNCGSVVLETPIKVKRYKRIFVSWYDLHGIHRSAEFEGKLAYTIQHEVEHNLGCLIIDPEKKRLKAWG